ncbi:unnamed protein product [Rhizoctonia solani]|uniref:Peptidase C14 caspase domain-containing protein n=1 Tax=Rhizoctonia solani TaxID=456999 RepID=A0A8H2XXH1_9AGAM|nr:unnamed protein product [Rhizoctonia solani]
MVSNFSLVSDFTNTLIFDPHLAMSGQGYPLFFLVFISTLLAAMVRFVARSKPRETSLVLRPSALNGTRTANVGESDPGVGGCMSFQAYTRHSDGWVHSGSPRQKLYGLVIGIDNYPVLPSLSGAVADANAIAEFLKSDMDIPAEHIVTLRNDQATRARIIQEFQALWKNEDIRHDDPILVYYAGHGGLAKANKKWKERYGAQHIQVIFPFNYRHPSQRQDIPGPTGTRFNCIPDRTIAILLNKLAAEKGDNIVCSIIKNLN